MKRALPMLVCTLIALLLPAPIARSQEKLEPRESLDFDDAAKRLTFGPYSENDPEQQAIWKKLEATRKQMLMDIYDRTGLTLPTDRKVNVSAKNFSTGRIITLGWTTPQPYGSAMILSLPTMAKMNDDPFDTCRHELFHALQQCWLGPNHNKILPQWVQEGLATYAGGHGEDRLDRYKKYGTKLIKGLAKPWGPLDYVENYLAMVYIESTWGHDALKKFVRDITVLQVPWQKSLQEITGMDTQTFYDSAAKFSVDYVEKWGRGEIKRQTTRPAEPEKADAK